MTLKNLFIFGWALASLLAPFHLWGQVCDASGPIWLKSQQEVDEFQSLYGPCDVLDQKLEIRGDDINDLRPLSDLIHVGNVFDGAVLGNLEVRGNPVLTSLVGLESIQSVQGDLIIAGNPQILDLTGLAGIETINQTLNIDRNENLQSLSGLNENFFVVGISISGNDKLQALSGLENVITPRYLGLNISGNDSLTNLRGLPEFPGIRALTVGGNAGLGSLHGLQFAQNEEPIFVSIQNNPSITNLAGLEGMISGSTIFIVRNESLESLQGLENLQSFENLQIVDNPVLVDLSSLESLTSANDFYIADNVSLSDCSSLYRLFDVIDHGAPGPGPDHHELLRHIPDMGDFPVLNGNAEGCNSVSDLIDMVIVERVMSGSWFSPESSGEGFMIHVANEHIVNPFTNQPGLAIGYFYGYDENGEHFWMIGVHEGEMNWDEPIEFTATRVFGGSFGAFDSSFITEQIWGSFSFTPTHCGAGLIEITGQFEEGGDIQSKTLDVIRLGKVSGDYCSEEEYVGFSDSLTASWFDPATSGQGLAIHKIDDESGIVYFYGFDANGAPLWLIGVWSGEVVLGEALEIQMIQVSGGTFSEVNPQNIEEEAWGVLRLNLSDCATGTAELEGLDGNQTLEIQQLAPSLGLECR